MLKVTYIISHLEQSLEFEWLVALIDRSRFELSFIMMNSHDSSPLAQKIVANGLEVYHLPFTSKKDYPVALWKCYLLLRQIKPAIVHAHLFDASLVGLAAAKMAGVKHRIYTRHHSSWHHAYFPKMVKYDRFINRLATKVVAISEGVAQILSDWEGLPKNKIEIIHHGVDPERFEQVTASEVNQLQNKYNPHSQSPVIGVIARYTEWKGIQYIIPAFKKILKDFPEALLVLANAKGDYAAEIKNLLNELPTNSYVEIEFEPNLFALYQLFDVFVHTPIDEHSEAFGQIYIEALAAGTPSVFTKSGAALGFAVHLENCYIVDYHQSEGILEGIKQLLSDKELRSKLIAQGKQLAQTDFHVRKKIDRLEALYAHTAGLT